MKPVSHLLTAALISGFACLPAQGADIRFDNSWKHQRFSLFSKNSYGLNGKRLDVRSDGSVSLVYYRLDPMLWTAGAASWSWQVDQSVPATDLARKGGDDRNISLYAVYLPPKDAERLKGASVRKLLTTKTARVLTYVWGGNYKRRSLIPSPYIGERGASIILRPSGTGGFKERVDLKADYKRAFGADDAVLVGIAVSADSDDTDTNIVASLSDLKIN